MAAVRMGFEGKIYHGTAGSTASTEITNSRDINYDIEYEEGDTTVRGDGSVVPIGTSEPVIRNVTITLQMIDVASDTSLTALVAAATGATLIAIRTKSHSSGTGFDGDCHCTVRRGKPLRGEQTLEFTFKPSAKHRTPSLNA